MALEFLRRQSFEWTGADRDGSPLSVSGVVRERIGSDIFRRDMLRVNLPSDVADTYVGTRFADFIVLTDKVEGLPWWPDANAPSDQLAAACERWQLLPVPLMSAWSSAIQEATEPPSLSPAPVAEAAEESVDQVEAADPNG